MGRGVPGFGVNRLSFICGTAPIGKLLFLGRYYETIGHYVGTAPWQSSFWTLRTIGWVAFSHMFGLFGCGTMPLGPDEFRMPRPIHAGELEGFMTDLGREVCPGLSVCDRVFIMMDGPLLASLFFFDVTNDLVICGPAPIGGRLFFDVRENDYVSFSHIVLFRVGACWCGHDGRWP